MAAPVLSLGERLRAPAMRRYLQFLVIVIGAGAMYPIMYLRQNFETTILEAYALDPSELGELYSLLGIVFTVCYLPSGWLADRVSPRRLMSIGLLAVGLLGFWFASYPGFDALRLIFLGWGLAGGLLFWSSLIKAVKLLALPSEQARFFGILDGGRGLVEALLASLAVAMFAAAVASGAGAQLSLRPIVWLYSGTCALFAVLIYWLVDEQVPEAEARDPAHAPTGEGLAADLAILLRVPQLWVMAFIIFTGHQLFWATYSFSAFLQLQYGMTAVAAGAVTLSKLWMRPVGGITAGFLGDMMSRELLLAAVFLLASLGLLGMCYLPIGGSVVLVMAVVLAMGCFTYAIHGLYWALLDHCPVPPRLTGLAIGMVSFVGFMPDVLLPLVDGALSRHFPRAESLRIYFTGIAACGLVGAIACLYFRSIRVEPGGAVSRALSSG